MQAPMQTPMQENELPMHNGQPILTYDESIKPYKSMILRAWLADRFKISENSAYADAYAETPPLPMQKEELPMQTPMQENGLPMQDLPPNSTPNVEFYERIIAAKDETISELKTQVETKDLQIWELIKSKEHSDILLQTALKTPQLTAAQPSEPQPPTDAPPLFRYIVIAILVLFAVAFGYLIAKE